MALKREEWPWSLGNSKLFALQISKEKFLETTKKNKLILNGDIVFLKNFHVTMQLV